ncbi:MAG: hypothetical protein Q6363_008175 [Candidatus Njordarchaeota archaeon]
MKREIIVEILGVVKREKLVLEEDQDPDKALNDFLKKFDDSIIRIYVGGRILVIPKELHNDLFGQQSVSILDLVAGLKNKSAEKEAIDGIIGKAEEIKRLLEEIAETVDSLKWTILMMQNANE